MKALQNDFPKSRLSDLLGTSRGFFYYQPNQGVRAQEDTVLSDQIKQAWAKSRQTPRYFVLPDKSDLDSDITQKRLHFPYFHSCYD